jgi:hypothetical protein
MGKWLGFMWLRIMESCLAINQLISFWLHESGLFLDVLRNCRINCTLKFFDSGDTYEIWLMCVRTTRTATDHSDTTLQRQSVFVTRCRILKDLAQWSILVVLNSPVFYFTIHCDFHCIASKKCVHIPVYSSLHMLRFFQEY